MPLLLSWPIQPLWVNCCVAVDSVCQLLHVVVTRHDTVSSPKTEKLELGQVRLTPEKGNSMFPLQCSQVGHFLSTCSFCTGTEPAHQWREKSWPAKYNFLSVVPQLCVSCGNRKHCHFLNSLALEQMSPGRRKRSNNHRVCASTSVRWIPLFKQNCPLYRLAWLLKKMEDDTPMFYSCYNQNTPMNN